MQPELVTDVSGSAAPGGTDWSSLDQENPMPDPHLRAADSDRTAVAEQLGRHLSDGRLTLDEYEERLARAYAARTYGDLDELTADLPRAAATAHASPSALPSFSSPVGPAPSATPQRAPSGACEPAWGRYGRPGAWSSWVTTAVIVTTIWLLTSLGSGFHYFWPIWVVGPWGAVLLARTLTGRGSPARRRGRRGW
jgi:hypothetical protein